MEKSINISRFKIYIASLLENLEYDKQYNSEIPEIKRAAKNIGSIITTNYDKLIEDIFEFIPLIGNDILLSEPYGTLYKIHGTVDLPASIIISEKDYQDFAERYELIRAQLLSIFIHNPIIFLGYSISDLNIKSILRTIFKYVPSNSELAQRIRSNFLLVEFERGSQSLEVVEHDIDMEGFSTIRINRITTDNYIELYKCISRLDLPVSAMDIRKVQSVFKEIRAGGDIKVEVTEDLDTVKNSEKIIAIGSKNSIRYEYKNKKDIIAMYFEIIDKEIRDIIKAIDKNTIGTNEWFPAHGFTTIFPELESKDRLISSQDEKIEAFKTSDLPQSCYHVHKAIRDVFEDDDISISNKMNAICWGTINGNIDLDDIEIYLKEHSSKVTQYDSPHRKLLCIYDYMKFPISTSS